MGPIDCSTVLKATCLRPRYSLRRQIVSSYATVVCITTLIVVGVAAIAALQAGHEIKDSTQVMLERQIAEIILSSSEYGAEIFSERVGAMKGKAALLAELVRDRIVGYPEDGWEDDRYVPFESWDFEGNTTKSRQYPLRAPYPPQELDYNLRGASYEQLLESFQERIPYFDPMVDDFSTASTMVYSPRDCQPLCADGVENVANSTEKPMIQKAADIGLFLKPIFETSQEIANVGVYFANQGLGATVEYPAYYRATNNSYTSIGCDWMAELNPYTQKPLASAAMRRMCAPEGSLVQWRNYRPLERDFVRFFAVNPGRQLLYGPYKDASRQIWWISVGQSIFDRRTGEFIGVVTLDLSVTLADDILESFRNSIPTIGDNLEAAVILNDGSLLAGGDRNATWAKSRRPVWETTYIGKSEFEALSTFDWDSQWDPKEVQEHFSQLVKDNHYVYSAHPVPTMPTEYEPDYEPEFFLFIRVDNGVYSEVDKLHTQIDEDVISLITRAVAIGGGGGILLLLIIWSVARVLTRPLAWMNAISWRIVNHTNVRAGHELEDIFKGQKDPADPRDSTFKSGGCTPYTEISDLVTEFSEMIRGFSGKGASSVATMVREIRNTYALQPEVKMAYEALPRTNGRSQRYGSERSFNSGCNSITAHSTTIPSSGTNPEDHPQFKNQEMHAAGLSAVGHESEDLSLRMETASFSSYLKHHQSTDQTHCHLGSHINSTAERLRTHEDYFEQEMTNQFGVSWSWCLSQTSLATVSSRLFLWLIALLVVPLLLTNITIGVIVNSEIRHTIPSWMNLLNGTSLNMELSSLEVMANLQATVLSSAMKSPIDDLLFYNRVAGWVIFGAIARASGIPDSTLLGEQCKATPDVDMCPYYENELNRPCDCSWRDPTADVCSEYSSDTRQLQKGFVLSQRDDTDPVTGNRNSSKSFPEALTSGNTTNWWENVEDLPGFEVGVTPSGYDTAYERYLLVSSLATISVPLYNYVSTGGLRRRHVIAAFTGFEADGMFGGYAGCNHDFGLHAHFETGPSLATETRPELCPVGKHGFDPRCREWHAVGTKAIIQNEDPLFVTPPYLFSTERIVGSSAVSFLVDPATNEAIAHSLLDFSLDLESIQNTSKGFAFMITPDSFVSGSDTVFGPGFKVGDNAASVAEVVLPFDAEGSENVDAFANITADMKRAGINQTWFQRLVVVEHDDDHPGHGNAEMEGYYMVQENVSVAYAPVFIRALSPIQPDDYSRGSRHSLELVYSLGYARTETSLRDPFHVAEKQIQNELDKIADSFIVIIIVVSVVAIILTSQISVAVAKPMILLLHVVKNMNMYARDQEIPPLNGGSREVNQVYNSFTKLCKIVRVSNSAYFSGNLEWALRFLTDALRLYLKQGDSKAIAIAHNNLGNAHHVVSRQKRRPDTCKLHVDGTCAVANALENYAEAIRIGSMECKPNDLVEVRAGYELQLSDRHFNRGLCLLLSTDDPCSPRDAASLGYSDISTSKDLFYNATKALVDRRKLLSVSDQQFERLLNRLNGLLDLYHDEKVREIWQPREVLDELGNFLSASWNVPNSPLFREISRVGRMQQVEAVSMRLDLKTGHADKAGRTALRMLVEDEFLIDNCFVWAAESLFRATKRGTSFAAWGEEPVSVLKSQLRDLLVTCKRSYTSATKSVIFCYELSEDWKDRPSELDRIAAGSLALYDDCCKYPDQVGVAASHMMDMRVKDPANQRETLDLASRTLMSEKTRCEFLSGAVLLLEHNPASREHENIILWVTDGTSWDSETVVNIQGRIEELNSAWPCDIHVIVIGLDVTSEEAQRDCTALGRISWGSKFVKSSLETIDRDFELVASTLFLHGCSSGNLVAHGVTVEKF